MIVINDLIGFPLSASMANFLVFLVLCHPFSSVQVPCGGSPKFLAFSVPLLFPWRFIYSVTLSAVIFFLDISIPLMGAKCIRVLHKYSHTIRELRNEDTVSPKSVAHQESPQRSNGCFYTIPTSSCTCPLTCLSRQLVLHRFPCFL